MYKKLIIMFAVVAGLALADAPAANAWVYRRVAPVRRVLAPPYPIARRAIVGPRYYRRPVAYGFRGPVVYGPGVFVGVGF
ncbi:hypothetical protein [Bythopirellula goksoeyrii]|uniref:Uncharacterized protein n=1 Tax=Bythopirellula goksoeyrii TaxID=1400387 RepID=A0A5B9QI21_9BACT|nr:hypothetical protein [Bythopirellula goksoeyrii]QEG33773.1 hypothetical protein Pr1d_10430 [Bythopirellula goksoeyrii]